MSIARGLVGWWRFDGNLTDASGAGNHATVEVGSEAYTAGVYGQARDYDGSSADLLLGPGSVFYGPDNDFSVSFWAKADLPLPQTNMIGAANDGVNTLLQIRFNHDGVTGQIRVFFRKEGNIFRELIIPSGHPIGQWVHVCGTYSDTYGLRFYANGNLLDSETPMEGNFAPLQYGVGCGAQENRGSFTSHLTGQIDNAMIFNRALSQPEIKRLYAKGTPL